MPRRRNKARLPGEMVTYCDVSARRVLRRPLTMSTWTRLPVVEFQTFSVRLLAAVITALSWRSHATMVTFSFVTLSSSGGGLYFLPGKGEPSGRSGKRKKRNVPQRGKRVGDAPAATVKHHGTYNNNKKKKSSYTVCLAHPGAFVICLVAIKKPTTVSHLRPAGVMLRSTTKLFMWHKSGSLFRNCFLNLLT